MNCRLFGRTQYHHKFNSTTSADCSVTSTSYPISNSFNLSSQFSANSNLSFNFSTDEKESLDFYPISENNIDSGASLDEAESIIRIDDENASSIRFEEDSTVTTTKNKSINDPILKSYYSDSGLCFANFNETFVGQSTKNSKLGSSSFSTHVNQKINESKKSDTRGFQGCLNVLPPPYNPLFDRYKGMSLREAIYGKRKQEEAVRSKYSSKVERNSRTVEKVNAFEEKIRKQDDNNNDLKTQILGRGISDQKDVMALKNSDNSTSASLMDTSPEILVRDAAAYSNLDKTAIEFIEGSLLSSNLNNESREYLTSDCFSSTELDAERIAQTLLKPSPFMGG